MVDVGHTTGDYALNPTGLSCSIDKVPTAYELKSSYNAETASFNPEITWSSSDNMTKAFKSAGLYYSYDKGNSWILAKTVTSASGTESISVAPGYTSYMFRIAETPVDALSNIEAFKPSATAQGPELSYSPAIESVTLSGKVTDGYNATDKTFSHTIKAIINSDLQITMKATVKAYINYSTDGSQTWSENIPVSFNELTGEVSITVPVKESYTYRFSANSYVESIATALTSTSEVYAVSDFYDEDGIGKYDKTAYQPAQTNADGKYIIENTGNLINTIGKANADELKSDAVIEIANDISVPDETLIIPTIQSQSFAGTVNGNGHTISGVLKADASVFGGNVTANDLTVKGNLKITHEINTGEVIQTPEFTACANGTTKFDYSLETFTFEDLANAISMPIDQSSVKVKKIDYVRSAQYVKPYMSVCLPFDLNASVLPGSESKIYKFNKFLIKDNIGYVDFVKVRGTVPAGTPFIIKTDESSTDSDWSLQLITEGYAKLNLSPIEPTEASALAGAFETKVIGEGYYKLNDEGTKLTKTTATSHIYPFRAYLGLANAESVTTFALSFEAEPSGVEAIDADGLSDNSPVDVYDLAGNLVARQIIISEASNVLSNGIYVAGSKLILINK